MRLAIHCTAPTQGELRFTIEMCEHYLNSLARTSRQYYTRLRRRALKDLIALQLKEFKNNLK